MSAHDELFAAAAAPNMLAVFGDCGRFVYEPKGGDGQIGTPVAAIIFDETQERIGPQETKRVRFVQVSAAACVGPKGETPKVGDRFRIDDERQYAIEAVFGGDELTIRGEFIGLVEKTRNGYRS